MPFRTLQPLRRARSALFGVGVGYQFNNWLRFDMTGEFRGKSLFIAQDKYPGGNSTFNRASNDA